MRTSQKFDPVFAALYDAEDDENRWSHIAEALSGCLDATTVRVTAVREATGDVLLDALTRDWPKSVLQEYDSYYQDLDPRMQAVTDRIGTTVTCVELPAQEDFDRSEFVADFLDRPDVDARWGMLQIRRSWDGMLLRIGACRRRARGPFLTDEKSEFDAALRHVFHALELDGRLISLKAERDNLAGTLEVDRTPAIILTTDMRAQYMNPAAAKLVGDGKSLRIVAGRLVANQSRDNGLLDRIVKRAAPSLRPCARSSRRRTPSLALTGRRNSSDFWPGI
jgi:PAS domain-containing protein